MGAPEKGSLVDRFFQLGYVTRDGEAAMAAFRERFGPVEFNIVTGTGEHPHTRRIALTYIGPTMYEIIEVNDQVPSIYIDALPPPGSAIRFHHTGHLIDDYPAMQRRLAKEGREIVMGITSDMLDVAYIDMRAELGHYVEYVRLGEEGKQWFGSIPGFSGFPEA